MRLRVLRNLSWVAVFAGPVVAAGSPEYPQLVIFALTFATSAAVTLAWLNGRTTKRPVREPLSHVRPVLPPPTPLEDALRMSWWDRQRDNLDAIGRTLEVGIDVHSGLCWDGRRIVCVCGLDDAGAA